MTPQVRQRHSSPTVRDLTLLILLTIVLNAPFVGMAFHLDDIQYLELAQNVYANPLFPMDLPSVFEGQHLTFWGHTHPPLNGYVIAALLLFHGRTASEVFLHGAFLIFPVLATVSFYILARRYLQHPLTAATLFATNPTLMVSAHTLMTDVPFLALWLCATALFVLGLDRNSKPLLTTAILPITAACFYAYQALALIPLLAFYALCRRQFGKIVVLVLSVPLLLMGAWQFSGYLHRGVIYISMMMGYLEARGILEGSAKTRTAIATLTYLGGTVLPFPFVFWRMGLRWKGMLVGTGLVLAVPIAVFRFADYSLLQKIFFVACFAAGVAITLWILNSGVTAFRARLKGETLDDAFLTLWFLGMFVACIIAFFSGSARYLLPCLPALLLLLIRADEKQFGSLHRVRAFYVALLATQIALGFYLSASDYEFADIGRREARDFQSRYLQTRQPFLFSAEWGLRHYLTSLGGEVMANDTTGAPGELVVKSRLALGRTFENDLDRSLERLEEKPYDIRSPIRLLDQHSRAGFWSDGWGVLPFWFSTEKLDDLTIYRVPQ